MPRVTSQNTEPDTSEQDGMQQGGDHLQDSLARVQTDQDQLEQLELAPDPSTDSSTDSSTGNDPMMDDDVVPSDPVDAAVVALWDQLLSARAESSPGDRPTLTRNIAAELQDYMAGERTNGDVIDRLFEMRTMILGEQASIMYVVHDWTLPSLDALINGMSGLPSQKPMAREEMLEPLALLDRQEVKKASRSARRTFPEVVAIVAQVDQYFLGAVGKSGLIDAALAAADSIGDSTVGTIGDRNRAVWLLEDLVATLRQDTMPAQLGDIGKEHGRKHGLQRGMMAAMVSGLTGVTSLGLKEGERMLHAKRADILRMVEGAIDPDELPGTLSAQLTQVLEEAPDSEDQAALALGPTTTDYVGAGVSTLGGPMLGMDMVAPMVDSGIEAGGRTAKGVTQHFINQGEKTKGKRARKAGRKRQTELRQLSSGILAQHGLDGPASVGEMVGFYRFISGDSAQLSAVHGMRYVGITMGLVERGNLRAVMQHLESELGWSSEKVSKVVFGRESEDGLLARQTRHRARRMVKYGR